MFISVKIFLLMLTGSIASKRDRQLGWLGKANFNGCTDPGAKELDSWQPHHFSAAGVPTNADKCLEAVQSDLTGHSGCFM